MPQIPEATIDLILDRVGDTLEAVRIQNQAMVVLADQLADCAKVLMAIHDAVTQESDNQLATLLTEIAETGRTNSKMLQQLLSKD